MEITKVEFVDVNKKANGGHFIAVCDVVLDNCICLKGIILCAKKNSSEFYLIFPSKQDVYKSIKELNTGVDIVFPDNAREKFFIDDNKSYEEFFHPVSKEFYLKLLDVISEAFDFCISKKGDIIKAYYKPTLVNG